MIDIVEILNGDYPEIKDSAGMSDTIRSYASQARTALETTRFRFNRSQDPVWGAEEKERWLQAARASAEEFKHYRAMARRNMDRGW